MKNANDRRVIRTQHAIKQAFEEMVLADHDGHGITVSQLAAHAGINRKTFYLHYDSIVDLADSYVDDIAQDLIARLGTHTMEEYQNNWELFMHVFDEFFTSNREFYTYVMTSGEYSFLARRVQLELTQFLQAELVSQVHQEDGAATIIANFIVTNMMMMVRLHAAGTTGMDVTQIRDQLMKLTVVGLAGMGLVKDDSPSTSLATN